jgi:hypothetical protein
MFRLLSRPRECGGGCEFLNCTVIQTLELLVKRSVQYLFHSRFQYRCHVLKKSFEMSE